MSKYKGIVRPAQPADLPALRGVLANEGVLAAINESFAGTGRHYFVAEKNDGQVVGVMGLTPHGIDPDLVEDGENVIELVSAYVADEYRGSGAGSALADHLEVVAKEWGHDKLIVVSGWRNRGNGYAFWTKRYGAPLYQDDFFGPGQERVVWSMALEPQASRSLLEEIA